MAAAAQERRRQPARERLEQRVRARVVAARREIDVVRAQELGKRSRRQAARRRGCVRTSPCVLPANVTSNESRSRLRSSHSSTSAPLRGLSDQLRRDHAQPATCARLARCRRMKDRRVDRVVDHDRDRAGRARARGACRGCTRLQDRRVGELAIDLDDPPVGAVVEAAIDADRPVDAMHHAHAVAREPPQPREVEVEGVEEAGRRPAGEPVRPRRRDRGARARRTSASRNWLPPPYGGGANSWKTARSAAAAPRAQPVGLGPAAACERPHRLRGDCAARVGASGEMVICLLTDV